MCKYNYITLFIVSLLTSHITLAAQPSATELLDKFAATQDKLQSFIYKCETSCESRNNLPAYKKSSGKQTEFCEVRYDGNRTSSLSRLHLWV